MSDHAFGQQLTEFRRRRGISQCSLALECDVDHSFIGRLESGKREPSRATVERIADALELDAADRAMLVVSAGFWPGEQGATLALAAMAVTS